MAIVGGSHDPSSSAGRMWTFADLLSQMPQAIPEVPVPFWQPKIVDGEVYFQFTKEELEKSTKPFRFAMVLKFLRQRPSLDRIHGFIHSRWGVMHQHVVSAMWKAQHVFIRFFHEDDFLKALLRESCDIAGIGYWPFQWSIDFNEDFKPALVPIWII